MNNETKQSLYKYFKRTTKKELFAICCDQAMVLVGEDEANKSPWLILEHLEFEKTIVIENKLIVF